MLMHIPPTLAEPRDDGVVFTAKAGNSVGTLWLSRERACFSFGATAKNSVELSNDFNSLCAAIEEFALNWEFEGPPDLFFFAFQIMLEAPSSEEISAGRS
jgi:hypothetical protein